MPSINLAFTVIILEFLTVVRNSVLEFLALRVEYFCRISEPLSPRYDVVQSIILLLLIELQLPESRSMLSNFYYKNLISVFSALPGFRFYVSNKAPNAAQKVMCLKFVNLCLTEWGSALQYTRWWRYFFIITFIEYTRIQRCFYDQLQPPAWPVEHKFFWKHSTP